MASVGFRWLDILEKEFDKAFVELDLTVGEWDPEEPDAVFNIRQKLCTLSSCFAQLSHKAQTIFQNGAKIEAELINMRAELVDSKTKREILEQDLHSLLVQFHASQLSNLPEGPCDDHKSANVNNIRKKLEAELKIAPKTSADRNYQIEETRSKIENAQLMSENASLRNSILALNSEVYGAKLAAKYLDKELAGRIQQLQLLGREMRGDVRDKLWRQLESEILLQRHKTVVRACRRNNKINGNKNAEREECPKPITLTEAEVRTVLVKRKLAQGLGISITGGREHGVPILISELETKGPAAATGKLFIGDAILFVNGKDLRQACHKEAVDILQQQTGDCLLKVQYIAADDSDNSIEEDSYNLSRYSDNMDEGRDESSGKNISDNATETPTAPRTPESNMSRCTSRTSTRNYPPEEEAVVEKMKRMPNKLDVYQKVLLDSKIVANSSYKFSKKKQSETTLKTENIVENEINNYKIINSNNNNNNNNNTKKEIRIKNSPDIQLVDETKETNFLHKIIPFISKDDISLISDILLSDKRNDKDDLIRFEDVEIETDANKGDHFDSTSSDNFSSPMRTSTDVILDSDSLSSPKSSRIKNSILVGFGGFDQKSDQSLLISEDEEVEEELQEEEECSEDENYTAKKRKSNKKQKKRYFGVKTLQSIFNKRVGNNNGYSDVSTTASSDELEEKKKDYEENKQTGMQLEYKKMKELKEKNEKTLGGEEMERTVHKCSTIYSETSPQFEKNVHNILSDIFLKSNVLTSSVQQQQKQPQKQPVNKKYFGFHGQNLRVGKALRLCPNENNCGDLFLGGEQQRKEKLLARYVYSNNSKGGEGVGDPLFGTPV